MTIDFTTLVSLAASGAVALLLALVLRLANSRGRIRMQRRFERVRKNASTGPGSADAPSLRRMERVSAIPGLDALIRRWLPRPAALRTRLQRAGLDKISVAEYVLACVAFWAVTALGIAHLAGFPPRVAILAGAAGALLVPHLFLDRLIARRAKKFTDQFADAIDLIVRSLKSGLPIPEAIRAVGIEMHDPIAAEFRAVAERINLGMPLEDALWAAAERIGTAEFRFFVVSLSVQRETGGNLAETLENLSDLLRRRRQMQLKIKAMSSEARASAMILGSLPFALFAILALVNPGYALTLFQDPRGIVMVAAGLGSLLVGVLVMAKMVRFDT
jgi:tight adherence protein B